MLTARSVIGKLRLWSANPPRFDRLLYLGRLYLSMNQADFFGQGLALCCMLGKFFAAAAAAFALGYSPPNDEHLFAVTQGFIRS